MALAKACSVRLSPSRVRYSLGPTDRYLRVAPGFPSHDLLAMAPPPLRTKLRAAIQQASQKNARIVVPGRTPRSASPRSRL
jgi:two-component system, chemotaxis family, CheB/CheR fusion protein